MISCFDEKKFAKDLDVIIKYQYLCGAKRNKYPSFHQAEKRKSCLTWDDGYIPSERMVFP